MNELEYNRDKDEWMTEYCEGNTTDYKKYDEIPNNIIELWDSFGDVCIDDDECIEYEWNGFPKGINRKDIWHWFENKFHVSVAMLMYKLESL